LGSGAGAGAAMDVVIGAHADGAGRTGPQLVFGDLSPGAEGVGLHGPGVGVRAAPTLADLGSGPSGGLAGARIDTLHEERAASVPGAGRFLVRLGVLFVGAMLVAGVGVWLLASQLTDTTATPVDEPVPAADAATPVPDGAAAAIDTAAVAEAPDVQSTASTVGQTPASAATDAATTSGATVAPTSAAGAAATLPVVPPDAGTKQAGTTTAGTTAATATTKEGPAVDEVDPDEPELNVRVGGGDAAAAPVVEDAPAVPTMTGSWTGSAGGRSLALSVSSQDGERFSGRLTITTADGDHTASISGTVSPGGGRLVIREAGGEEYLFEGLVRGSGAMGTYTRGGQGGQSWSLRRD
jgi:hypothetical protein